MNAIIIEPLEPIKLPLVQKLYKQYYPSAKAKKDELIFTAYCHNNLCAVVRFRTIDKWRLLTGMLVIPEYRQQGIAHLLMQECQRQTLKEGDYCFAFEHLAQFYTQHGFKSVAANALPNTLEQLFQRYSNSGKHIIAMKFVNN